MLVAMDPGALRLAGTTWRCWRARRANQRIVSSPLCKNIPLRRRPKSELELPPSRPTQGRIAIVTDAGRDAVDADSVGRARESQGGINSVSDIRRADDRRFSRTAKPCG